MTRWKVIFFPRRGQPHAPLDEILSWPDDDQTSVRHRIEYLRDNDLSDWPRVWIKKHTGDLWELKVDACRLMYTLDTATIVIVHAFHKSSRKTRRRNLERAIANYQSYLEWKRKQ